MDKIQEENQTGWNFQSEKCEVKPRKINSIISRMVSIFQYYDFTVHIQRILS